MVKSKLCFFQSFSKFLIFFIITAFICIIIIKGVYLKNEKTSNDYQVLSSIDPDDIIHYQINYPSSWKEYTALISAFKQYSMYPNEIFNKLAIQLQDKRLYELDWNGVEKNLIKQTYNYYNLLNEYNVFIPTEYIFPVERSCYYTDTFGAAREAGKRSHEGTDLFDEKGTKILSVCAGVVEKIGWNRLGGERIGIRGDDGNYYYYAHLDQINENLAVAQRVNKGQIIGIMGNTGDAISTPYHLHFGIELPNGQWLNPYPFLKVWEFNTFKNK